MSPGLGAPIAKKSDTWAMFASAWQYLIPFEPVRDVDPSDGQWTDSAIRGTDDGFLVGARLHVDL